MKVMFATTKEQEMHIEELIEYINFSILPRFFTEDELSAFEKLNILSLTECPVFNGTMRDAFQVMSSLQTLICVIESVSSMSDLAAYSDLFEKNIRILYDFGINFPFKLNHFLQEKQEYMNMYEKPNQVFLM